MRIEQQRERRPAYQHIRAKLHHRRGKLSTEYRVLPTEYCLLVPSKGLEPPHRCRYMDLNHARLPIPPRWQVDSIAGQLASRRKDLSKHFTDTQNNPPAVLLQLCTHRDFRVEHFRNRTPLLRRFRVFLECSRVCPGHLAHDIDVTLRDRPSRIELLER
jgi:hypothetical protein